MSKLQSYDFSSGLNNQNNIHQNVNIYITNKMQCKLQTYSFYTVCFYTVCFYTVSTVCLYYLCFYCLFLHCLFLHCLFLHCLFPYCLFLHCFYTVCFHTVYFYTVSTLSVSPLQIKTALSVLVLCVQFLHKTEAAEQTHTVSSCWCLENDSDTKLLTEDRLRVSTQIS